MEKRAETTALISISRALAFLALQCRVHRMLACALALLLLPGIASLSPNARAEGQEKVEGADKKPVNQLLPPLYDARMLRLSEILGSLHYLRQLCGAGEGQTWRNEMDKIITTEKPSAQRKAKLTASFNKGYRGYSEVYRECTPAAVEAANRHLREAVRISAEIPSRYGN